MALRIIPSKLWEMLLHWWPLLLYTITWTFLLTITGAVAAFSPQMAFAWAVSPSSSFERLCRIDGAVRLPSDGSPREVVCVPSHLFDRSSFDVLIPPLFAVMVVACSVFVTRAVGLWEDDEEDAMNGGVP